MPKTPNILLLFSDQHSARALGCYGNAEVKTPHLDSLADEGVRLERAYCNNPICTPSRMCYTSGQYCHNHGYYGLMGPKPENLPSLFSYFSSHGYRTGIAGKIHTPTGWLAPDCDYLADGQGYETARMSPGDTAEQMKIHESRGDAYQQYLDDLGLGHLRDDRIIHEWAERHGRSGAGQGLDARPSRLPADQTIEAWTAEHTCRFLEESSRDDRPFCFWMTVPRPHQTYLPARKFWDLYNEDDFIFPPNASNTMHDRFSAAQKALAGFKSDHWMIFEPQEQEAARRRVLRGYYGCVSQVDDAVGRVMKAVNSLGLRKNTIIIYTSDHGEFAGEHGMIEKAPGIGFHCVTRVPQIWSWPDHLPQGVVRHSIVESVDFIPTVAALAGLPAPNWVDGINMESVLRHDIPVKDIAVTENPLAKTITDGRYKFTQYLPSMCEGRDFGELFDLETDPWEMKNLYFDSNSSEIVARFRLRLYDWLVTSTRNRTVNPSAPNPGDTPGFRAWDQAEDLYGDDRRIGSEVCQELIRRSAMNYL